MKIIQLEYFVAVVKYNSFTKAANFLHISQPSLTATIKDGSRFRLRLIHSYNQGNKNH